MDEKHYVLGTAGHIDHGKTRLTRALTGVDTDRLQEEKERNISIEPGFAPLTLPSGRRLSIVDVPGHERFIRQMVSGVTGIDFVLLVVAADDGVMPQTREHLSILNLLGIREGLIVLSKIDRADPELLPIIEEDVRDTAKGTFLENAPLIRTSAVTGEGIQEILDTLDQKLPHLEERKSDAPFRLPVDRAFTVKGAGAVVTGTVQSGSVTPGTDLLVQPEGFPVKVRQIQVHGQTVPIAQAGQRAALNLSGIDHRNLARGQTIIKPEAWNPTWRMDIRAISLHDLSFSVRQRSRVKVLIGTAEVFADLIFYDRKEWKPGEEVYASLILEEPVVAGRGDRFILRRPTPATTLGGGEVVEPRAPKRKIRSSAAETIRQLHFSPLPQRILEMLKHALLLDAVDIARSAGESVDAVSTELEALNREGSALKLGDRYASAEALGVLEKQLKDGLKEYHENHPMYDGIPKAEWASRFLPSLSSKDANTLLEHWEEAGWIHLKGDSVALASFVPSLPKRLKPKAQSLLERLRREGLSPSEWSLLSAEADLDPEEGEDLRGYLIRQKKLVPLTADLLIHRDSFDGAAAAVKRIIHQNGTLTMQQAKKEFSLSRKYLIPLLERMDQEGITRRKGNERVLTKS
ncbi:selenocysteine-specific translation elongation factor SelB [Melghirimyces profundicolus]|uniref:Selenocysteine-specific elongation factor n=1 Tax=Melghirimyces profundicolus TaxID=1242148 RepID=A0A2T6C9G2_9BACL|nr:selenocysteine-specific translation elongation factor [Melghirimyces profundicolus]PTX64941.1 selenocysteine-specific translation elongation factor SelB [Melghirimyces profundicolus]